MTTGAQSRKSFLHGPLVSLTMGAHMEAVLKTVELWEKRANLNGQTSAAILNSNSSALRLAARTFTLLFAHAMKAILLR